MAPRTSSRGEGATDQITASKVLTPHGVVRNHGVTVRDGLISAMGPIPGRPEYDLLTPGFIDIQVNGLNDVDVAQADEAGWKRLGELLLAQGVTTWCPTIVTTHRAGYADVLPRIGRLVDRQERGPEVAGVHLEGPFLGQRHGAHRGVPAGPVDVAWLRDLPDLVRIVTLGPERPNASDAIAALAERGTLIALGHTSAGYDATLEAIDAGARLFTHCFNAAEPLHHRRPGAVGAALTDDRIAVSMIADTVHVHPAVIDLVWRCKPKGRVLVITDSVAGAARALGGAPLAAEGHVPTLADGTLAGGAAAMNVAIANVAAAGPGLEAAVDAATTAPAALLDLGDRGELSVGRRADLVALDPDMAVAATWQNGRRVFTARPDPP